MKKEEILKEFFYQLRVTEDAARFMTKYIKHENISNDQLKQELETLTKINKDLTTLAFGKTVECWIPLGIYVDEDFTVDKMKK